ncbi:hypothetical protein [Alistipes putredinis]|uniref:hypothetical protein n=1 Tax=Alistipes putredinis TaxID=28117 RepID=UPI003AB8173F
MNKFLYPLLFLQFVVVSCSSNGRTPPAADNTNLRIDQDRIFTPVVINATDTLEMLFDTGCLVGCMLPQSLAENYADSLTVTQSGAVVSHIAVEDISLGGRSLNDNRIYHVPDEEFDVVGPVDLACLIAPAYATEKRIWCFDFDNRMFSIRETDTLPENAIVYPLLFAKYKDRKIAPFVNIPTTLSYGDRSLSTDYVYLLDTGTPYGFAITDPPAELEDFVSRIPHWKIEDRFCAEIPDRQLLDFEVDIDMPPFVLPDVRCDFDTGLRSYAEEFKNFLPGIGKPIVGTLGMRILKHFNMILDFRNDRLILVPAQRTYPSKPANRTGFWCDSQGVVTRIRTNDAAYGQGLRLKDTVMTVDGIRWTDIPEEKREDIYSTEERTVWEIRSAEGTKKIII